MALVERHCGLFGLTHADQFLEGIASGSWVIFIDTEEGLGSAIIRVNDDDSSEVYASGSAGYNYWQHNVNDTGDFVMGADLTNGQMRRMNVVLWMEGFLVPSVLDADSVMQGQGLNSAQRTIGVAAILVSQGIPPSNANAIATSYIGSATKPKYTELGIVDLTNRMKRMVGLLAGRSDTT